MARFVLVVLAVVALACLAQASFPRDWAKLRSAFDNEVISFSVALNQRNVAQLEVRCCLGAFGL